MSFGREMGKKEEQKKKKKRKGEEVERGQDIGEKVAEARASWRFISFSQSQWKALFYL